MCHIIESKYRENINNYERNSNHSIFLIFLLTGNIICLYKACITALQVANNKMRIFI